MERTELTVSIEPERLDALNYYLARDGSSAQKELGRMLAELYETKVPQETRGYIDSKLTPPKPKRPPRPAAKPRTQKEEHHEQ